MNKKEKTASNRSVKPVRKRMIIDKAGIKKDNGIEMR